MRNYLLLTLATILATGCSGGGGGSAGQKTLASSTCVTDAPVNLEGLAVQGSLKANVGETVEYHLSQSLDCSSSQTVEWKAAHSSNLDTKKSEIVSSYSKPGRYLVAAQIGDTSEAARKSSNASRVIGMTTVVVDAQPAILGPQIVVVGEDVQFDLAVNSSFDLKSASWNFGDGTPSESSLGPIVHNYQMIGRFTINVTMVDSGGGTISLSHPVNVIDFYDGLECAPQTSIVGPSEGVAGEPVDLSVFIPSCLRSSFVRAGWDFGDRTVSVNGENVSHTYAQAGTYEIKVAIHTNLDSNAPFAVLSHMITIDEAPPAPTPTPVVSPTPNPSPTPPPNSCPAVGATRSSYSAEYDRNATCGLDGTKVQTMKDLIREQCARVSGVLTWTIVSKTPEVVREGACQNQSCLLQDGSKISHGGTKSGLKNGEVSVPKVCTFKEQGIFDIYHKLVDQSCSNGVVSSSNERRGEIKTAGVCPTYSWAPTQEWTQCSENCGGSQSQIFKCADDKGATAPAERCTASAPKVSRVCDGNPDAVKRSDVVTSQEEANSSEICPKNQVGVVVKIRTVTKTSNFACIDHTVKKASENTTYSPWVTERYCRDYVAKRCSHDSLSNNEATGRYNWMLKCKDQVPVIAEFLEKFDDVKVGGYEIDSSRKLYPTFMNRATNPEKAWIAPKVATGSCTVPSTAYIAAVCVASCATPDQQILVEEARNSYKSRQMTYVDALLSSKSAVMSLESGSSVEKHSVKAMAVDQWVTELLDTNHEVIEFSMKSGGKLKLTPNHPILGEDGQMREAKDFKAGDKLVRLGGSTDPIVSIARANHYGKVYNVFVKSNDPVRNVVVTNGYLNGTAFFQNEGAEFLNRQLLKSKLIKGAVKK